MKFFVISFVSFFYSFYIYAKDLKIVSLAPNLTEIIYALGAEKYLVGNTTACDYPEDAKKIYKIGSFNQFDSEKIVQLKTTHVFAAEGTPLSKLNQLKNFGIKVFYFKPETANDLVNIIKIIGKELKKTEISDILSKNIENKLEKIKSKKSNKKFFMIIQYNPIYSVSEDSWLGDLFFKAGFINIVGKSKIKFPIVSIEYLKINKPELILVSRVKNKNDIDSINYHRNYLLTIYTKEELENIKIVLIPNDVLVRPGPRIIEGLNFIESI